MLKAFLIRIVLDAVFEALITALREKVEDTDSQVDDKLLQVVADEKDTIKKAIKDKL